MTYTEKRLELFDEKFSKGIPPMIIHSGSRFEHPEIKAFLAESIHQAEQEMMKRVMEVIEKNDLGLYSGDVKSLVDLLSSLDKLTDKE